MSINGPNLPDHIGLFMETMPTLWNDDYPHMDERFGPLIRPLSRPSDNSLETFTPNVCLLSDRLGWKTEVIRVESVSIIHCLDQDDPSSRGHYHS